MLLLQRALKTSELGVCPIGAGHMALHCVGLSQAVAAAPQSAVCPLPALQHVHVPCSTQVPLCKGRCPHRQPALQCCNGHSHN